MMPADILEFIGVLDDCGRGLHRDLLTAFLLSWLKTPSAMRAWSTKSFLHSRQVGADVDTSDLALSLWAAAVKTVGDGQVDSELEEMGKQCRTCLVVRIIVI